MTLCFFHALRDFIYIFKHICTPLWCFAVLLCGIKLRQRGCSTDIVCVNVFTRAGSHLATNQLAIVCLFFWFQMAMMVSSGFLIAWTPYVAVSFWSMFNSQKQGQMAPSITLLPCLFAKSSTVYNPFIYFIFQRNSGPRFFHFRRQVFSCSTKDSSTDEGGKVEGKKTKSPCSSTFGTRTDEICVGLAGNQSGSEMIMLDWNHMSDNTLYVDIIVQCVDLFALL